MPPEERNRIEDLKQSLYSRSAPDMRVRRSPRLQVDDTELKTDWEHPVEVFEGSADTESNEDHSMSFFTKLLIGSAIFCILAVGAGTYIFFNGGNFISGDNIEIDINGPTSIAGGMPVTLNITVTNKNTVALKATTLNVHFPAGSTDPEDTTSSLEDHKEVLGDIEPGASVSKTVSAVIFGAQNLQKEVRAAVTYGIAGSSSVFTKESTFDVLINSSPISLTVSTLKETISGQQFDMTVNIKSNSPNTLKNILLKSSYPFGYSFVSSSLKPVTDDRTVWSIGDIPPGGSRSISIKGSLAGEDTDLRAFRFSVGARSQSNPLSIGTVFQETESDITIAKPFVSVGIIINNDTTSGDVVGRFGKPANVNLKWVNNLPESISNMVITAHLAGTAYDKSNVSSLNGYYRSSTDDIIWNPQTNPEFASVPAGSSGNLSFTITPSQAGSSGTHIINPIFTVSAAASASRVGATNVPIATTATTRNVRVSSDISLSGRIVRTTGGILNYGPIPPVAEKKTTYTVVWTVDNTSNAVGNAVVTATLPPYVSWTNVISPSTEDISYDKNNGTVTWNIGNINTFTLGTSQRREVEFQIAFEPSVSQVGQYPVLINQAVLTATDNWTKSALQSTQSYLTTSFSTDPSYKYGDENVANKL